MSSESDWSDYQRAVTRIANAPAEVARRHTENANQTNARAQQAQAHLNQLADEHRTLTTRLDALERQVGSALTRYRVSPAGPATNLAHKPVTSIADATAQTEELSEELDSISERLDHLEQARGDLLRRTGIAVVYAAPGVLTAVAVLLTHGGWRLPAAAVVLVIAAMAVGARKTPRRKTIWPPVIAGIIVGALTLGVAAYSSFTGAVIGYALIALALIWIAFPRRSRKR